MKTSPVYEIDACFLGEFDGSPRERARRHNSATDGSGSSDHAFELSHDLHIDETRLPVFALNQELPAVATEHEINSTIGSI